MRELSAGLMTAGWRPVDVRLAPDGRMVAWVAAPYGNGGEHAESAIWVAPADGSAPPRRWTRGGADTHPRWSPDGTRLAFLSDRVSRGTAALHVLRMDGGEAEPLVVRTRAVAGFAWAPDGARIAFLAPDDPTEEDGRRERERDDADVRGERWPHARVRVVEVATGLVSGPLTGDAHVSEVAWSPDGTRLACVVRPTPELDTSLDAGVVVLPAAGGASREVCRWPAHGLVWTASGRLAFGGTHDRSTTSGSTVWSVDPDSGDAPLVIGTGREEPRCSTIAGGGGSVVVVVVVVDGLSTRVELRDATGGARHAVLHETRGSVPAADVAAGVVAVVEATGDRPAEVVAGRPGELRAISDHHAELRDVRFGEVRELTWTAPDGEALDGVLTMPPGAARGPLPAVVVPHGGPYGRSVAARELGWNAWGTWLAAAGYAVLRPNYRGGMGHGRRFASAAGGGVGGVELADVMSMVDAAVDRGIVDGARVAIGGWSQGGFLAAAAAVAHPDRFRTAIVGAGPVEWDMMSLTSDMPTFEAELAGGPPWQGGPARGGAERSPLRHAAGAAHIPVLILHGQEDRRVPVSQAIGFERALRALGADVTLVTYPREPHGIAELHHQRDVLTRVRDWCERHLDPDPEAAGRRPT